MLIIVGVGTPTRFVINRAATGELCPLEGQGCSLGIAASPLSGPMLSRL
jgi:hypothetical protein